MSHFTMHVSCVSTLASKIRKTIFFHTVPKVFFFTKALKYQQKILTRSL